MHLLKIQLSLFSSRELPDISEERDIKIGKCYLKQNEWQKARKFLDLGKNLAEERENKIWSKKALKYLLKIENV